MPGDPARIQLPSNAPVRVLALGLEPSTRSIIEQALNQCEVFEVPADIEKLMEPLQPEPQVILCGPMPQGISLLEVAQMMRMQYQNAEIYFACQFRQGYDRKNFKKNGFTEVFLLPMDAKVLNQSLMDALAKASKGAVKSFRPVKIVDLEAGSTLDFEARVYLPANKKYVVYFSAGDVVDPARAERLKKHLINSVQVNVTEMPKFYKYTATKLKKLSSANNLSETERKERMESSIRDLMSGIFSESEKDVTFDEGKAMIKDCSEIVKSFVLSSDSGEKDIYKRVLATVGEAGNNYSHAANVSTFAALFSMGLGIGKPEEMALAGLLHDVGLADVPADIAQKSETERTPDEAAVYKRHPESTIAMIKHKKLVVSEKVAKAIEQHHERFNGSGYPKGYVGSRICAEAQVLALADVFDELTAAVDGKPAMTPIQAVEHLRKQVVLDPTQMHFDPELLKRLLKLFGK